MSRFRLLLPLATSIHTVAGCTDAPTTVRSPTEQFVSSATRSGTASKEELGRLIFFDKRLSLNGNQACAACHDPAAGWTGAVSAINAGGAVYEGSVAGRFGNRKPPSSAYATPSPILHLEVDNTDRFFVGGNFWDGRATGEHLGNPAADQAQGPFLNSVEQALSAPSDVTSRICRGPYAAQFTAVWGQLVCEAAHVAEAFDAVALSIAAFEGSAKSNAFSSKFDQYRAKRARLDPEEKLGLALFRGKARCSGCHVLDGGPHGEPLFTDFTYDNIGVPKNPANPWYTMPPQLNPDGAHFLDKGLGGFLATRSDFAAFAPENTGKQKVPTLRNVDLRPSPRFVKAYSHNGYFKSLKGIVHFYNTRDVKPTCPGAFTEAQAMAAHCWPPPEIEANVNRAELGNLHLTAKQERALVAFLKTLSDGYRR